MTAPNHPVPRQGVCITCGRPLSEGEGMHWIATPPDGEHDQCRDWSRHPFPFDLQLEDLRRVTATLRHSYWTVVTFGRWVKDRRDQWPLDARATVTAFRARRDEVRRVPLEMTRRTRL